MWFGEEPAEARFVPGRPVKSRHECLPLLFVEHKSRLVRQGLFRALAGTAHDEVRDVHALALSRDLDESFFRSGSPELEPAVAGLFR
jgi:hypothetical protein